MGTKALALAVAISHGLSMVKANGARQVQINVHSYAFSKYREEPGTEIRGQGDDPWFSVFVRAQEKPQKYRFLRKHLANTYGLLECPSFDEVELSLEDAAVEKALEGLALEGKKQVIDLAVNARRDLRHAYREFREELDAQATSESEAEVGPVDGASGTGGSQPTRPAKAARSRRNAARKNSGDRQDNVRSGRSDQLAQGEAASGVTS